MFDFLATYELTRGRFSDLVSTLNHAQLNYRQNPDTLTAAEMALHVAGVELWFTSQILGTELNEADRKLAKCATDGSINDNPFPFSVEEMTVDFIKSCLNHTRIVAESLLKNTDPGVRQIELKSALGPVINGEGAMVRISAHAFYHMGQIYMITKSPNFPT